MGVIKQFILAIFTLYISFGYSQESIVSQLTADGTSLGGAIGTGQSFIALADYDITSISVLSLNNITATLYIFDNATASGTPIYSQAGINLLASLASSPLQEITLNDAVPIVGGQAYSFVLEIESGMGAVSLYGGGFVDDVYLQGSTLANDSGSYASYTDYDLAFEIKGIKKAVVAAPKAIPSISIIGLGLLFMVMGLISSSQLRKLKSTKYQ